jgi:hypothetical protein
VMWLTFPWPRSLDPMGSGADQHLPGVRPGLGGSPGGFEIRAVDGHLGRVLPECDKAEGPGIDPWPS